MDENREICREARAARCLRNRGQKHWRDFRSSHAVAGACLEACRDRGLHQFCGKRVGCGRWHAKQHAAIRRDRLLRCENRRRGPRITRLRTRPERGSSSGKKEREVSRAVTDGRNTERVEQFHGCGHIKNRLRTCSHDHGAAIADLHEIGGDIGAKRVTAVHATNPTRRKHANPSRRRQATPENGSRNRRSAACAVDARSGDITRRNLADFTHTRELIDLGIGEADDEFAFNHANRCRNCAFRTNSRCERAAQCGVRRSATKRIAHGSVNGIEKPRETRQFLAGQAMRHRSCFERNHGATRRERVGNLGMHANEISARV